MSIKELKTMNGGAGVHNFFVKKCVVREKKNGGKYVSGTVSDADGDMLFKVWDYGVVEYFMSNIVEGAVITATVSVSEYNGVKELIVQDVCLNTDIDKSDLQKSCDLSLVMVRFNKAIEGVLSERGIGIVNVILKGEVKDRFIKGYAASGHHDAIVGGLINHTTKCMELAKVVIQQHDLDERTADLIMLGTILHDIGKAFEMEDGVYTQRGAVFTHRGLGLEIIFNVKEFILSEYDEMFYYHLLAIIQGHHGEWGEPCHTVYTKVVHCVDMLETWGTKIAEGFEDKNDIIDYKAINTVLKY